MNSTPAASRARRTARSFAVVIIVASSVNSARLIVATLSADEWAKSSAVHRSNARAAIDDAMEMTIGSGDLKHTRQFDAMLGHLSVFQDDDHSLVDALEALIKCAIDDPDEFIEEPGRRFWETYVTFNRSEFSATLHLVVGDPVIPRLRHEAIDVVVEYAHPQTMHGGRGLRRAFQRVNTASATLFRNIGLAFRNGETP
jgi:hypothetical protein